MRLPQFIRRALPRSIPAIEPIEPRGSISPQKILSSIACAHFIAAASSTRKAAEYLRDQGFTLDQSLFLLANRT